MPSAQRPIDSGFTAASTAHDVLAGIDLSGKAAVVTGGHSGIGLETTRALSAAGASVVVPVRYPDKARERLEGIARVDVAHLDLIDPASIDAFAGTFLSSGRPLHMLIDSAGIMRVPLARDSRGYEAHFATNHLGHFQLATRLWVALRRANGARVVAVSAWAHRLSPVHLDDPNFERLRTTTGWPTPSPRPPTSSSRLRWTYAASRTASAASPCTQARSSPLTSRPGPPTRTAEP